MAFGCVLFLKSECDGCGECEHRIPFADDYDEGYDPYGPDYDDEE